MFDFCAQSLAYAYICSTRFRRLDERSSATRGARKRRMHKNSTARRLQKSTTSPGSALVAARTSFVVFAHHAPTLRLARARRTVLFDVADQISLERWMRDRLRRWTGFTRRSTSQRLAPSPFDRLTTALRFTKSATRTATRADERAPPEFRQWHPLPR